MITVAVLLSSYNGEKFIREQIISILNQKDVLVHLHIRDDGSSDSTLSIISNLKEEFPNQIFLHDYENKNIGIRNSFEYLMNETKNEYEYFSFSDQDDIWHVDKLTLLVNEIISSEKKNSDIPIMAFCDMEITNEQLVPKLNSFYNKTIGFNKAIAKATLLKGYISGCLMVFNKKSILEYFKLKRYLLHDFHIFQICRAKGLCRFVKKELIQHRIHERNEVGLSPKDDFITNFKNLVIYIFKQKKFRDFYLSDYYNLVRQLENDNDHLTEIGYTSQDQIDKMNILKRKKWLIDSYLPFRNGVFNGIVTLIIF